jgi:hypothetical protein
MCVWEIYQMCCKRVRMTLHLLVGRDELGEEWIPALLKSLIPAVLHNPALIPGEGVMVNVGL